MTPDNVRQAYAVLKALVSAASTFHQVLGFLTLVTGAYFLLLNPVDSAATPLWVAGTLVFIRGLWSMRKRYSGTPHDGSDFRGVQPFLLGAGAMAIAAVVILQWLVSHEIGTPSDYDLVVFIGDPSRSGEHAHLWLGVCLLFTSIQELATARWERSKLDLPPIDKNFRV